MARYAQVHEASGFVANVIMVDDIASWPTPAGYTMVADPEAVASPGYTYADGVFTPPPSPSPPPEEPLA